MRRNRRMSVFAASSLAVLLAAIGGQAWMNAKADADADAASLAAFEETRQEWLGAHRELVSATQTWNGARVEAAATAAAGNALVAASAPEFLADAATRTALQAAVDELVAAADLPVEEGGMGEPEPVSPPPIPAVEIPEGREARVAAAEELEQETGDVRREAEGRAADSASIAEADEDVHAAEAALIASAHRHGNETAPPELATHETKDAYLVAVAALEAPPTEADLPVLVETYQSAWAAAQRSHDAAVEAQKPPAPAPLAPSDPEVQPTYIGGVLIVNKTYPLPSWFGSGLTGETLSAFEAMRAAAAAEAGHDLYISSAFRSYARQRAIYSRYVASEGQAAADRHSARPGHSEHQSGLAFDLNCICEAFGHQDDGIWVRDNAHRFGLIVRYPPGREHATGYIWEPWHLRYVGVGLATELHSRGHTLEEHFGITSSYR